MKTRFAIACALLTGLSLLAGCTPPERASEKAAPPVNAARTPDAAAPEEVRFQTKDGVTIMGDLYRGTGDRAVVLLHQRGGSAKDWEPLSRALQRAGVTALAIDQRGAGRSTAGASGTGRDAPWETEADIAAALGTLTGSKTALAGASYGANNALLYAAEHPDRVAGVALFSPGVDYHGLNALDAAKRYLGRLLILHAKGDGVAGDGPQRIHDASPAADRTLRLYDGDGHGTDLLSAGGTEEAVAFFRR